MSQHALSTTLQMVGYRPELAYAVAACHYKLKDYASALKVVAEIVELGVREHPELGIGSQSEGVEVRWRSAGRTQHAKSPHLLATAAAEFQGMMWQQCVPWL